MDTKKLVKKLGFKEVFEPNYEKYEKDIVVDNEVGFKIVVLKYMNDISFTTYLMQGSDEIIIVNNTTYKFIEKMLKTFN